MRARQVCTPTRTICRANGVAQGYFQRAGGKEGCLPAGWQSQADLLLRFIIYWVQLGSQGIGNVAEASRPSKPPSCTHQSCCCRSLCKKRLCQLQAAAAAWLALLGVVPSWFDCQASRAHALSISSLQSRKLLFLIYWDRVKEVQLGKMVFNGAVATNQANYEHVKGKKPAGKQVACSHARGWFGMRRAALSEPRETWEDPHWERAVLNQAEQPEDNPCQWGSFGSTVRISSLDNLLKANVFS